LRRLRQEGAAIVYVTHRLDEVFELADRVTVLRNGRRIGTSATASLTRRELVRQIIGRDVDEAPVHRGDGGGAPVLELEDVVVERVGPVSLTVREGEIVGLVGLLGAGHEQIGRVVFGLLSPASGTVRLRGERLERGRIGAAIGRRVGFVSSKRAEESLAPTLTVRENLFLNPRLAGGRELRPVWPRAERAQAARAMEAFSVRPAGSADRVVTGLSGGNQQKVVLARWLRERRVLLVLEEPTMGVDVGAKLEIYGLLDASARQGTSVLVVSSDFEEVTRVCDRALVFSGGRVVAGIPRAELSVGRLTALALGSDPR
jgi:ribose transport system ATP-binding protein